jgi:hypothetical protein
MLLLLRRRAPGEAEGLAQERARRQHRQEEEEGAGCRGGGGGGGGGCWQGPPACPGSTDQHLCVCLDVGDGSIDRFSLIQAVELCIVRV